LEPERIDAGRTELDGQRYPVKLPADVDDDRHIDIPQCEFADNACCALDEELSGQEVECRQSAEIRQYSRNLQQLQAIKALALDTERLATGRQDLDTAGSPRHLESQSSSGSERRASWGMDPPRKYRGEVSNQRLPATVADR
jgi:hypothetical protein